MPGKDFLQLVELPTPATDTGDPGLRYDPEWLAVTKASLPAWHTNKQRWRPPPPSQSRAALQEAKAWVAGQFGSDGSLTVPTAFPKPIKDPGTRKLPQPGSNPQTLAFLAIIGEGQPVGAQPAKGAPAAAAAAGAADPDEIVVEESEEEESEEGQAAAAAAAAGGGEGSPASKRARLDPAAAAPMAVTAAPMSVTAPAFVPGPGAGRLQPFHRGPGSASGTSSGATAPAKRGGLMMSLPPPKNS